MMLLDSNIVIYATKPEYAELRRLMSDHAPVVSAITYVETLGYHKLTDSDRHDLKSFFDVAQIIPISDQVLDKAIFLRQQRKMSLGDAIIGATALVYNMTLVTRNTEDFDWIEKLTLYNPFEASSP